MFPREFVPELNTKNMDNSPRFLTITHTTLSAKWFRCYGISMMDVAAEFCFWTEQRWNGSSLFRLRLAETPEVLNTVSDENSLSFPMLYQTDPNG
jgi:hypothetical protein